MVETKAVSKVVKMADKKVVGKVVTMVVR